MDFATYMDRLDFNDVHRREETGNGRESFSNPSNGHRNNVRRHARGERAVRHPLIRTPVRLHLDTEIAESIEYLRMQSDESWGRCYAEEDNAVWNRKYAETPEGAFERVCGFDTFAKDWCECSHIQLTTNRQCDMRRNFS